MVSVIIPVYNNENLIGRCLESLLKQDYQDYEIIVVNDGSTDNTLTVCRKFESYKVKIIDKENSGASAARNTGLLNCDLDSRFVFFVDSDDTVAPNYISEMMRYALEDGLVISDYYIINERLSSDCINDDTAKKNIVRYVNPFENESFFKYLINGRLNPLWNKCFSLKIIRKYNIKIPTGFPEDFQFCFEYLKYCSEIVFLPNKIYNYIKRPGSITGKGYLELYDNYMKIQTLLYSIVPKKYHRYVDEFVYPQYLGNSMKYIRQGDFETVRDYIKMNPIRKAIYTHKTTCMGDFVIKYLLLLGWFKILRNL